MNIHLENIRFHLGKNEFHFDGKISEGITGIFGMSGAGKTTLMNVLSGSIKPSHGSLKVNEQLIFCKDTGIFIPPEKRNIGIVFQEGFLFPHLNVKKNLLFGSSYGGNRNIFDFDTVIKLLEISSLLHKKPSELSGGEKQRVAIGRTLLSQPEILLMDEPFSNLDRPRRKQIISYLLKINREFHIPLLIISHDLEDILKLTRNLLIISHGKIVANGDYLDIANQGLLPELISHHRFINVIELMHHHYHKESKINQFLFPPTDKGKEDIFLHTNSERFLDAQWHNKKTRLSILPDEIALSLTPLTGITIQNQIPVRISKIHTLAGSCYVSLDCGIELVAEITPKACEMLHLEIGKVIYCLIKAKAVEIIHIYE